MQIIHEGVQAYAEQNSTAETDLLKKIAAYTHAHHAHAKMLSGHLQGQFLQMISHIIKPTRILEIGTFTGYSALCLAEGLTPDGMLHTIELRDADADIAQNFFNQSIHQQKITLHRGNAATIIDTLNEKWDLVFIDADKTGYINYFNLVFPALRQNGIILADNIFFHGEVIDTENNTKNAAALKEFNTFINNRQDVQKLMLTLRDGIYILRKL